MGNTSSPRSPMPMIVTAPSEPEAEPPLILDEFWPEIDPVQTRQEQRLDNTITPHRLRAALREAAATSIAALAKWKSLQIAAGHAALAEITAEKIDNESILVHRFRRAVGCLAKALILERSRDFDATGKGERKAEFLTDPIDDLRRDHLNAIADIIGRPRTTVELI